MRPEDMETNTQTSLTPTNRVNQNLSTRMEHNFIHIPSIHEVDEEDDADESCTCGQEPNKEEKIQQEVVGENTHDNESTYTADSFCSDNESETSNATVKSVASSLVRDAADKLPKNKMLNCRYSEKDLENAIGDRIEQSSRFNKNIASEERSSAQRYARNRKNMSFTDEEVRKIERENQLLLRKIMAQQKPRERTFRGNVPQPRSSSSAINRKKFQKQIEYDNMLLLQRIQKTKSRVTSTAKSTSRLPFM